MLGMSTWKKRQAPSPIHGGEAACREVLLAAAGTALSTSSFVGNPLRAAVELVRKRVPPELYGLYADADGSERADGGAEVPPRGGALAAELPLRWRADVGAYVCGKFYDAFQELVHGPLAHGFAFGVPSEEAVDAVARHAPAAGVVEAGAGAGYWTAVLKEAGIDAVAHDLEPAGEGSQHFSASFAQVERAGGEESARIATETGRALLLCWPVNPGSMPWDAECLAAFGGDVLLHVGELEGDGVPPNAQPAGGQTTSAAFQAAVRAAGFERAERVAIPRFPFCFDALTVFKRSATVPNPPDR